MLLATFASLRWGKITALTLGDLDLEAGTVRVRVAFVERSTSGFNRLAGWAEAVRSIGVPNLHVHDLRHTGNMFEAGSGALASGT